MQRKDVNISDTSSSQDERPIDESQNPIDDGGDVNMGLEHRRSTASF